MPNAFFVVTGRNCLQWAETGLEGQLDWTGPNAWPGLVPEAAHAGSGVSGRQILIGDFSSEDCEDYLARRLSRDGQPLIDERVRRIIADRSHGLPLYLDLSVMRYLELRRGGRQLVSDASILRESVDLPIPPTPWKRNGHRTASFGDL